MQVKQIRYGLVVAVMAFLVAGCFSLGSPTPVPESPGSGDDADYEAEIRAFLNQYIEYVQEGDIDNLAALYTDNPTLVGLLPLHKDTLLERFEDEIGEIDDELDITPDLLEELERLLNEEAESNMEEQEMEGRVEVRVELRPHDVDDFFDQRMSVRVLDRDIIPELIADLIAVFTAEPQDGFGFEIVIGDPDIDVRDAGAVPEATVVLPILVYEDDDELGSLPMTLDVTRVGEGDVLWRIVLHEQIMAFVHDPGI